MNTRQRQYLERAIEIYGNHKSAEYNNDLQIKLAKQYLDDVIDAIQYSKDEPDIPRGLMLRPD